LPQPATWTQRHRCWSWSGPAPTEVGDGGRGQGRGGVDADDAVDGDAAQNVRYLLSAQVVQAPGSPIPGR
jgi:hypothetical protein